MARARFAVLLVADDVQEYRNSEAGLVKMSRCVLERHLRAAARQPTASANAIA